MYDSNGFMGIRFGQPLEMAHQRMTAQGFRFSGREASEAPIGRVLYIGQYKGKDAKVHLDFIRNGFHRSRLEIQADDFGMVEDFQKDLSRKYGPSERLTRNRQACTDDSPENPCYDVWSLDDDTSIIVDVTGTREKPLIIMELFKIL